MVDTLTNYSDSELSLTTEETGPSESVEEIPQKPSIDKHPPPHLRGSISSQADDTKPVPTVTSYPVSTLSEIHEEDTPVDQQALSRLAEASQPLQEEGQNTPITTYPPRPTTLPEDTGKLFGPTEIRPKDEDTTPVELANFSDDYPPLTEAQVADLNHFLKSSFSNLNDFIPFFRHLSQASTYNFLNNSTRTDQFVKLFDPNEKYLVKTDEGYHFRQVHPDYQNQLKQLYQRDLSAIFEPLLSPPESVSYEESARPAQLAQQVKNALANR